LPEDRGGVMIGNVESIAYIERGPNETRSAGPERLSVEASAPASVGELTVRQLELQRRLVRESLLLKPA
jgi:hypothetical protein